MKKKRIVLVLEMLIVGSQACAPNPPAPTPSSIAVAVMPSPMATRPTPSSTPTVLPPTATLAPSRTATRLPTNTRPRGTPTATQTRRSLEPDYWDPRLDPLGVKLIPSAPAAGRAYWRLRRAEFRDEKERQGKQHIFVNVLDQGGGRIVGQEVLVEWPGDKIVIVTEDKPAPEYSANFPLDISHYPPFATLGAFTVSVIGSTSDQVAGMGLPPRNKPVVFLLTFQRTTP